MSNISSYLTLHRIEYHHLTYTLIKFRKISNQKSIINNQLCSPKISKILLSVLQKFPKFRSLFSILYSPKIIQNFEDRHDRKKKEKILILFDYSTSSSNVLRGWYNFIAEAGSRGSRKNGNKKRGNKRGWEEEGKGGDETGDKIVEAIRCERRLRGL